MDADYLGKHRETKPKLASDVLSINIGSLKTQNLSSPITMGFILSEEKNSSVEALCVYWTNVGNTTVWSSNGCSMISAKGKTINCSCTHLTSFAVLVSLYPIPPHDEKNLQYITYVGIAVSLVCLLLSLMLFFICRSIKNIRITIHTHLCLSLFLAEMLFVVDIDKTENKIACKAIAIFLHYLFLACFAWMLLEGVQLYLMVVKVFHSRSLRRSYLYLFGYGTPLIIVVVTAAVDINAYGTKTYCWLTRNSGYIWAFLGPACAIIGLNAIFLIITVWKLVDKFSMLSTDIPHFKKVRSFTGTAIAQLFLLGGTWLFGMFHFTEGTIVMSYIFTGLNSFQGFFIFVFHCLLNKQVRNEFTNAFSKFCKSTSGTKGPGTSSKGLQNLQNTQVTNSKASSNIYG